MKRRAYLGAISTCGVSLLAGCGNSSNETESKPTPEPTPEATPTPTPVPDHEYAPDPWSVIQEDSGSSSSSVSGQGTLEAGQFALRQAQFERPYDVEVSVSVQDDNTIDLFGMSEAEFNRYRERETPVYYDGFYETAVENITLSGQVQAGEHRFVFDNSAVFGSDPSGEVTFEFETTVSL